MPDDNLPPPAPKETIRINTDESDEVTHFDKEQLYLDVIRPALERFQKLCQEHGVPMIAAVCSANNKETMNVTTAGAWGPAHFVPAPFFLARALIKDTDKSDQVAAFARLIGLKF